MDVIVSTRELLEGKTVHGAYCKIIESSETARRSSIFFVRAVNWIVLTLPEGVGKITPIQWEPIVLRN